MLGKQQSMLQELLAHARTTAGHGIEDGPPAMDAESRVSASGDQPLEKFSKERLFNLWVDQRAKASRLDQQVRRQGVSLEQHGDYISAMEVTNFKPSLPSSGNTVVMSTSSIAQDNAKLASMINGGFYDKRNGGCHSPQTRGR